MQLPVARRLQIRKRNFDFKSGWYIYVGSAFGPGGIKSRTDRHLALHRENAKTLYWQIDYLREAAVIEEIWFSHGEKSLEHEWSKAIAKHFGAEVPVRRFGSQDCQGPAACPAHLFRLAERPAAAVLRSVFKASKNPILVEFARSPQRKTAESGCDSTSLAASYHRGRRFLEELRVAVHDQSGHSPTDNMQREMKAIERDLVGRLTAGMNLDAKSYKQDIGFAVAVERLVFNCGQRALDVCFSTERPQSRKGVMQLSRTADTRQQYRIAGACDGKFKSVAPQGDDPVFDTVTFSEVPSRLSRARGSIHKCRVALAGGTTNQLAAECLALAELTRRVATQLRRLIAGGPAKTIKVSKNLRREVVQPVLNKRAVRGRIVGLLRCALKLTVKNVWDYPEMSERGITPTSDERTKSLDELSVIIAEAEKTIDNLRSKGQCRPGSGRSSER